MDDPNPIERHSPEDELRSPPSWECLDDMTENDYDECETRLSQAKACLSRSPRRKNDNKPDDKTHIRRDDGVRDLQKPSDITDEGRWTIFKGGTDGKHAVGMHSTHNDPTGTSDTAEQRFRVEAAETSQQQPTSHGPDQFYDTLNTMADTRLLWRIAPDVDMRNVPVGQRLRTPSDRESESVYDTVSSTSSSAPLLRKITQELDLSLNDDKIQDLDVAKPFKSRSLENIGKSILTRTLEQVKKSLEDLAPSPEAELYSQVMGAPSVYRISKIYIKNLIVLSVCFMILYTAFFSLRNLQSSINQEGGLGLAGLACLSASFIIFCITAPSIVHKVRPKYALVISMSGHLLFEIANFYPSFYTLIPASIFLGCSMSCLWVAQGTYLTSIAVTYATVTGKKHDGIIGLFNGIFLFCLQLAQILGNLLSSFVFNVSLWNDARDEVPAPAPAPHLHRTYISPAAEGPLQYDNTIVHKIHGQDSSSNASLVTVPPASDLQCGVSYCHVNIIDHDELDLRQNTIYALLSVFIALTFIAIGIMAMFLDKLDVIFHKNKSGARQQLVILGTLHKDHKIWLLSMLLIFLGMEQAYMFGEITKAFITCPLGVHMIGYVMVCFGACDSIMSFICGQLQRTGSTRIILTAGALLHMVLMLVALLWQPDSSRVYLIFMFAGALGVADAIWQTQLCNLVGCLYPRDREAAFASLRMYEGIGYTLAFAYAQYLCMEVKTYILFGTLVVAMINYYVMDFLQGRTPKPASYPPVDV